MYQIEIGGKMYYDWYFTPDGKAGVNLAPNEKWQTPLNFDTHAGYFGPGPKTELVEELKAEIQSRV